MLNALQNMNEDKTIRLIFFTPEKNMYVKDLSLLEPGEERQFKSMGKATGTDFYHCLYLANKYQEDFLDRVLAFSLSIESSEAITLTEKTGEQCICVEFFEEKE